MLVRLILAIAKIKSNNDIIITTVACDENCLGSPDLITGCTECLSGFESPHCCTCASGYIRLGSECVGRYFNSNALCCASDVSSQLC